MLYLCTKVGCLLYYFPCALVFLSFKIVLFVLITIDASSVFEYNCNFQESIVFAANFKRYLQKRTSMKCFNLNILKKGLLMFLLQFLFLGFLCSSVCFNCFHKQRVNNQTVANVVSATKISCLFLDQKHFKLFFLDERIGLLFH